MTRALQAIATFIILGSIGAYAVQQASDFGNFARGASDSATKAMAGPTTELSEMHSSPENDIVLTTSAPERLAMTTVASMEVTSQGQVDDPSHKVASLVNTQESQTTGSMTSDGLAALNLIRRHKGDQNPGSVPTSLLHEADASYTEVTVESTKTSSQTNEKVLIVSGLDVNGRRSAFNGIYYPGPDSTADVTCKQTWIKPCRETDVEACLQPDFFATYKFVYSEALSSSPPLRQWSLELHSQGGGLQADGRAYQGADDSSCSPETLGGDQGWLATDQLDKSDVPTVAIYTTTTTTSTTTTTTTTTTTPPPATPSPGQAGIISTSSQAITTSNTDHDTGKGAALPGSSRQWLKLFLPFLAWLAVEGQRLSA